MDWTLEHDMVDGLFFCTTLLGRGHTAFVQSGAETSNTNTEAIQLDPPCSWIHLLFGAIAPNTSRLHKMHSVLALPKSSTILLYLLHFVCYIYQKGDLEPL